VSVSDANATAATAPASALLLAPQGVLAGLPAEPAPLGFGPGRVSFTAFCEPDAVKTSNLRVGAAAPAACLRCASP